VTRRVAVTARLADREEPVPVRIPVPDRTPVQSTRVQQTVPGNDS
jgi:hypothetical protein